MEVDTAPADQAPPLSRQLLAGPPDTAADRLMSYVLAGAATGAPTERILAELSQLSQARVCGKTFRDGDLVYSCLRCGVDPTCVLCPDCFMASAHRDHEHKVYTSSGGGCCDCGDHEAWKSHPGCSMHSGSAAGTGDGTSQEALDGSIALLPADIARRAREVFPDLLRQIMEVLLVQSDAEFARLDLGPGSELNQVVLLNDEVHSFDDVITQLHLAVGPNHDARLTANIVDRDGRALVFEGAMELCEVVIEVLTSCEPPLVAMSHNTAVIRAQTSAINLLRASIDLASASQGLRRLIGKALSAAPALSDRDTPLGGSTLDTFAPLYYQLWKQPRAIFKELVLASLWVEPDLKKLLAEWFTARYREIMVGHELDTQNDYESFSIVSVQLFTVPSIARHLVANMQALHVILSYIREQLDLVVADGTIQLEGPSNRTLEGSYVEPLADIGFLLRHEEMVSIAPWAEEIIALHALMQGMDPHVRETGIHVEHETNASMYGLRMMYRFNGMLLADPLQNIVAQGPSTATAFAKAVVQKLLHTASPFHFAPSETSRDSISHGRVMAYQVASQPVSMHCPLQRIVAALFGMTGGALDLPTLLAIDSHAPFDSVAVATAVLEPALRMAVLSAQVDANMWIRNGYSIPTLLLNYRAPAIRTYTFDMDIVCLQMGAALLGLDHLLAIAEDRFGLSEWLRGAVDEQEQAVKRSVTVERFLETIIYVLGERYTRGVGQATTDQVLEREILHVLALGPTPFSTFRKRLSKDVLEHDRFQHCLARVAVTQDATDGKPTQFSVRPENEWMLNQFFYHYERRSSGKIDHAFQQRSKANASGFQPFQGPPPFVKALSRISLGFTSRHFLNMLFNILHRACTDDSEASDRPSASSVSELIIAQALHLIILGLHEDQHVPTLQFRQRLAEFECAPHGTILDLLRALQSMAFWRTGGDEPVFGNELAWVLKHCGVGEQMSTEADKGSEAKAKRERARARAKKRREKMLAKMKKQQSRFAADSSSSSHDMDSSSTEVDSAPDPSLGDSRSVSREISSSSAGAASDHALEGASMCLHCQEEGLATGERPFVQLGCAFRTRIDPPSPDQGDDELEGLRDTSNAPPSEAVGTMVRTCGHTMHADCWLRFTLGRRPGNHLRRLEFLCPLCGTVSNLAIPLVPPAESPPARAGAQSSVPEILEDLLPRAKRPLNPMKMANAFSTEMMVALNVALSTGQVAEELQGGEKLEAFPEAPVLQAKAIDIVIGSTIMTTLDVSQKASGSAALFAALYNTSRYLAARHESDPSVDKSALNGLGSLVALHLQSSGPLESVIRKLLQALQAGAGESKSVLSWDPLHTFLQLLVIGTALRVDLTEAATELCLQLVALRAIFAALSSAGTDVGMGSEAEAPLYVAVKAECPWLRAQLQAGELHSAVSRACEAFVTTARLSAAHLNAASEVATPDVDRLLALDSPQLRAWCRQLPGDARVGRLLAAPSVSLDLIDLPREYSSILTDARRQVCPATNQSRSFPALCLICGAYACVSSPCCMVMKKVEPGNAQPVRCGGCCQHAFRCSAGVGIFLLVRTSQVLLLDHDRHNYIASPYVDEHGEQDQGLNRGRPLFLNDALYGKLRLAWRNRQTTNDLVRSLEIYRSDRHYLF